MSENKRSRSASLARSTVPSHDRPAKNGGYRRVSLVWYGRKGLGGSVNRRRGLVAAAVALLVAGAAASCDGESGEAVASVPTQEAPVGEDRPGTTALLVGELRGDAEQRCLWLEPIGEYAAIGERVSVVWPHGYAARFEPVPQLLDEEGRVVAEDGDVVETTGGTTDSIDSCKVSTKMWSTHSVARTASRAPAAPTECTGSPSDPAACTEPPLDEHGYIVTEPEGD